MTRNDIILADGRAPGSPRAFGFTMAAIGSIFLVLPLFSGRQPNMALAALTITVGLVSWLRPQLLAPANRLWLAFGQRLHKVTSLVVLAALFFLVLTPIALALRAFGSDRLGLKRAPASGSYWTQRSSENRKADFDRPF